MLLFFVDPSRLVLCYFSFPIAFRLSQLTAITGGKFKLMNSSGIVYPYLSTPIGKLFLVSIYLFCSLPISREKPIFSVMLCLSTTITLLKPVSCDHLTSLNYMGRRQGMSALLVDFILVDVILPYLRILCLRVSSMKAWGRG